MLGDKCIHFRKLSTNMSVASRSQASSQLKSLQKMIEKGTEIVWNLDDLTGQLRQSGVQAQPYVSYKLKDNENGIKNIFDKCSDLVIRKFYMANDPEHYAMIAYFDGMVKQELIEEFIQKLTAKPAVDSAYTSDDKDYAQYLLGIRPEDMYEELDQVSDAIVNSKLVLFIDGVNKALTIDFKNPPARNVEQPEVESSLRGPKEGFTESLRTNTCLLRKKIKSEKLKIESLKLGKQTKTDVSICYLSGIANEKIINELRERVQKIDIDAVLGTNYILEYIQDSPSFVLPTVFRTEKPDVLAAKLLEGRIAIIADGTPIALTVPCLWVEFLQTDDDYTLKFIPATLNRWVRYLSFFINLTLSGFYVSLLTFHHELIPDSLVPSILKSRAGVPLPAMWECFAMLFVYEVLREAGVRMPRVVGPAVSIVGALVLGQAAVDAGFVSTPTVVVVGFTAIASLTITAPEMSMSLIFPRFVFLFLGGSLGMLGLIGGVMIMFMNMISIRSFGVPYMGPLAPLVVNELSDVAIRAPLETMTRRPKLITWKQSIRRKSN